MKKLIFILLLVPFSLYSQFIEIRRGGGSTTATATNAIAHTDGKGTNTQFYGQTKFNSSTDFRSGIQADGITVTNTAALNGAIVALSTADILGLVTLYSGLTMAGGTTSVGDLNSSGTSALTDVTISGAFSYNSAETNGQTLFVMQGGNDSNGQRGNRWRPYATMLHAQSNAVSGDLIVVFPGTYTDNDLGKDGVDWYFMPGVVLDPGANLWTFCHTNNGNASYNISGSAVSTNGFIWITNGTVNAELLEVGSVTNAQDCIYVGSTSIDATNAVLNIKVKEKIVGDVKIIGSALRLETPLFQDRVLHVIQNISASKPVSVLKIDRFIRSFLWSEGSTADAPFHRTDVYIKYAKGPAYQMTTDAESSYIMDISDGQMHIHGGKFVSGDTEDMINIDSSAMSSSTLDGTSSIGSITILRVSGTNYAINASSGTSLSLRGDIHSNAPLDPNISMIGAGGRFYQSPALWAIAHE